MFVCVLFWCSCISSDHATHVLIHAYIRFFTDEIMGDVEVGKIDRIPSKIEFV